MKITFFQILIGLMLAGAAYSSTSSAQGILEKEVTVPAKRQSISNVLQYLKENYNIQFIYSVNTIDVNKKISIHQENKSLKSLLDALHVTQGIDYEVIKDNIVLSNSQKEPLQEADGQNPNAEQISGTVKDKNGLPLIGVSVREKGTKNGAATDENGQFKIKVIDRNSVLIISYIGFVSQEIPVQDKNILSIILQEDVSALNEVVVVGYGTQKKANLTGAVSQVNMDDVLKSRPVTNIANALQGSLPGLNITSPSGQPGTSFNLNIRGYTSLNGGGPLILLDNVAIDNLNTINPNDIESVTELKDAGASAIYGARAAYGVILITTKKGKANQKTKFEYSVNITPTEIYNTPKKASPTEFVNALLAIGQTSWWAGQNLATWKTLLETYDQDRSAYPGGLTKVNGTYYPLQEHDQYKDAFPGGFEQIHNFAASGGSEKIFFRTSVGYSDLDGPFTNNDTYKLWNFNTSLTAQIAKPLSVEANVLYNNGVQISPDNYRFDNLAKYPSFSPIGFFTDPVTGNKTPYRNPANTSAGEPVQKKQSNQIRLYTKLIYSPIKNLAITSEIAYDQPSYFNISSRETGNLYTNPTNFSTELLNTTSNYSKQNYYQTHTTINLYAKYAINTKNGHNFDFLVGTNREVRQESEFNINRSNLITSQVPSITTATGPIGGGDSYLAYAVQALFGRANYNYKNRYLLEVNGRYDGSSRFAKGKQYGFFPSASAGWNISQESFMESLQKIIPLLKLRFSYGSVGNQNVSEYGYLPILSANTASWLNPATGTSYVSINPPNLISTNYTWETVQTANLGFDIGLFDNRLTSSFEYYRRNTLNMLVASGQAPALLGTNFPRQNSADLKTLGTELTINWQDKIGVVGYSLGFNLSHNESYITRYKNNPAGLLNDYYEGQRIGDIWGYTTQGYFKKEDFVTGNINPSTQLPYAGTTSQLLPGIAPFKGEKPNPGDLRYVDFNNDGVIYNGSNTLNDHGDITIIGNSNPKYYFGINGSASYKNFDFSFLLRGEGKGSRNINNAVTVPYKDQYQDIFKDQLDFWTPDNQGARFARIYPQATGNTQRFGYNNIQTKYLYNTAFLRVQSLGLGYTLSPDLTKKISFDRIRLFFSGENLFLFNKLPKGVESEGVSFSSDVQYPFLRKYSFGLDVTF